MQSCCKEERQQIMGKQGFDEQGNRVRCMDESNKQDEGRCENNNCPSGTCSVKQEWNKAKDFTIKEDFRKDESSSGSV